jgi:glyoxylase-like metal-dependent hydrolase (beta-lactamase superfamily II)
MAKTFTTCLFVVFTGACTAGERAPARAPAPESSVAYRHAAEARKAEDPTLVWTPAQVALVARELAPGVFAVYPDDAAPKNAAGVPVATSGGFVIGANGVLLVDTMINRALAEQLLALVREHTDKPILYAVNTSYHGDHSYGNQFLPKSTQVIQHIKTQSYIQQSFPKDVAFMSQYFGTHSGLEELRPQVAAMLLGNGEARDIELGGKQVHVMHLGFAQTEGDLFVSVPGDKVLFTGNPIISEGPSMPWLLDGHSSEALATLQRLRGMFPDDTRVVPGHGVPTTMATIDGHIRYLQELEREVAAAIAEGLDAAKTSERVGQRMQARYGGYKIYPWVHVQLNVAKVYDELTQRPAVR